MDALEGALVAPASSAPARGKARSTKRTVKRETPRELRARGAAGTCTAHGGTCGRNGDGKFATANGRAYHEEHGGQF
jgi:hypothetical protein